MSGISSTSKFLSSKKLLVSCSSSFCLLTKHTPDFRIPTEAKQLASSFRQNTKNRHWPVFCILSECRDSNPESPGPKPGMLAVTPHSDIVNVFISYHIFIKTHPLSTGNIMINIVVCFYRGVGLVVECLPSKQETRVRFSYAALKINEVNFLGVKYLCLSINM